MKNPNNTIAWLTGILTLLLAVFSFALSFIALTDLANTHGVSIPLLFPLVTEAAVVIFSLNALYRSINGESAQWQWVLIIGSSLIAGTFNVLHSDPDLVSRVMAAMPSFFLLLSFETFLGQIKHAVKRSSLIDSLERLERRLEQMRSSLRSRFEQERSTLNAEIERLGQDLNDKRSTVQELDQEIERKRSTIVQLGDEVEQLSRSKKAAEIVQYDVLNAHNEQVLNEKQQKLNELLNYYRSNPHASLNEAGEAIERSKGTVSNYLNELEQAGLIHRNGQGVEVLQ